MKFYINEKGQAQPNKTVPMTDRDFTDDGHTSLYWLGNAGTMINTHGTVIMIDPLLEGFDMPVLIDPPINPENIPHVNAVLISHVDNDHYSRETLSKMNDKIDEAHASYYVASLMPDECGIEGIGHDIGEEFKINDIRITLTPCDHAWQNLMEEFSYRVWEDREYCGYYIRTEDCTIWYVGDSRLMDCQLEMEAPDVFLFDFSDNEMHIGLENAYKLANAYPDSKLVCVHWGTVDAPDFTPFNGNPQNLIDNIVNPERVVVLAPGEKYTVV